MPKLTPENEPLSSYTSVTKKKKKKKYGRYIGMARVPHMRNTNMHRKISAKTERLAVKGCYHYYLTVYLSNKPKYMAGNHR